MRNKKNAPSAESMKTGQRLFFSSYSEVGKELRPIPTVKCRPNQSTRTEFSKKAVLQYKSPQSSKALPILHLNKLINGDSSANKLITPKELAEFLGISKSSVYLLVETRRLPFYKVGGNLRFKMSDVEEYLKSVRVEPIVKSKI